MSCNLNLQIRYQTKEKTRFGTIYINAVGVANRTSHEVKEKWKNLTSSAKKKFSDIRRQQRQTVGGPSPKEPSMVQEKIMKLFEGTPLFTGLV